MKKNKLKNIYHQSNLDVMCHNLAIQTIVNRKGRGLKVKDLATLSGVSVRTIKLIERSKCLTVEITDLIKIANAFDIGLQVKFSKLEDVMIIDHSDEYLVMPFQTEETLDNSEQE